MIRFVDLRWQDCDGRFSLYDTVRSEYIKFDGSCQWDTWMDLDADMLLDEANRDYRARVEKLIPVWAHHLDSGGYVGEDDPRAILDLALVHDIKDRGALVDAIVKYLDTIS